MTKILQHFILLTILISNSFVLKTESVSAHQHAQKTHDNIIQILQTKNALFKEKIPIFLFKKLVMLSVR